MLEWTAREAPMESPFRSWSMVAAGAGSGAAAAPRALPPRRRGADRYEGRLRHEPVRLVYGAARRRCREVVHVPRRAGRRRVDHDDRRARLGQRQLHSLQEAFWAKHGLQCGFCTPGMVLAAHELLRKNPSPTQEQIRHGLEGNLCRCTGLPEHRPRGAACRHPAAASRRPIVSAPRPRGCSDRGSGGARIPG